MHCVRQAPEQLWPWVKQLWVATGARTITREHVLPTGDMHLAFRLSGPELRLYEGVEDEHGMQLGRAVVAGPRSAFYAKEAGAGACSAGAVLSPQGARELFGVPAHHLADCHTPLADLWGSADSAASLDQMQAAASSAQALDRLESLLTTRLRNSPVIHPAVRSVLAALAGNRPIGDAVRETGYSHRRLLELFRASIGLTPKAWCRVRRFRRTLAALAAGRASLTGVALASGYSDQPHFNREFLAFAGVTPTAYLAARPANPRHVTVGGK